MTTKQDGRNAADAYLTSPQYAQYEATADAMAVMKLFLPPMECGLMQISQPLPRDRRDWLEGFEERRKELAALRSDNR